MAPWEVLWRSAMACIASLKGYFPRPEWTFGGGTALMLQYGHRRSKDIDIFLRDPRPSEVRWDPCATDVTAVGCREMRCLALRHRGRPYVWSGVRLGQRDDPVARV